MVIMDPFRLLPVPPDRASDMHPGLTLMTWNSLTVEITDVAPVVRSMAAGGADGTENRFFFGPQKVVGRLGNSRKMSSM